MSGNKRDKKKNDKDDIRSLNELKTESNPCKN